MCGIFGFYYNSEITENEIDLGISSLKKISHRGPDDLKYWFNKSKGIFLGHTRLSVIDLSENNSQPFSDDDQKLVFNGEIYNYKNLKYKLEKNGEKFSTSGDTEVLSRILKNKDIDLTEVDGMFSYAVFKDNILEIGRDFFGEKPLYYYNDENKFIFSSEPHPIIFFEKLKKNNDEFAKKEFELFGFNNFYSHYKNLNELPPSSKMIIKNSNIIDIKDIWKIPNINTGNKEIKPFSEIEKKKVKNILIESVENRLNSDVPVCLLLSSGIDSTLIAAILKKELSKNIKCFTATSQIKEIDEKNNSKEISKYLGLDHDFIEIKTNQKNFKQMLDIYGDVNENLTVLSIKEICKKVKENYKVCLSGLGGDEIFAGYNKHKFFFKHQKLFDNKFLKNLHNFIYKNFNISFNDYFSENQIFKILKFRNGISTKNENIVPEIIAKYENNYKNIYPFLVHYEFAYNLPKLIIPAIDRGGMSEGIEIRTPYLNKELAENVLNLGYERLIKYGRKSLLVGILKDYIPEKYILSKKRGFVHPEYFKFSKNKAMFRKKILEEFYQ